MSAGVAGRLGEPALPEILLAASTAFVLVVAFALPPEPTTLASTNQEDMAGHDMSGMAMTVDSEEAFITGMLPHHQDAVDSARAILGTTERPEVRSLAQDVIASQSAEIETLTSWLERRLRGR